MLTINYNGAIKLNFNGPIELADWWDRRAADTLETAKKTKAAKEAIALRAKAASYSEMAALLRATTITPLPAAA